MLLLSLLLPKKTFSPLENRYLAKAPELSWATLESGEFMEEAEDYVDDHVAGRDIWVGIKALSELVSGKRENNGIYFAKDKTLISQVAEPDPDQLLQGIGAVDALAGNVSVPVYFGLIPTAATIWADKLPEGAPNADETALIDQLYFAVGAQTVDLEDALAAHRDEAIYYRTDHHWTSLGAYYGANALLTAMGLEPLDLADYPCTTVSDQFYGTSYSTSGAWWIPPDSIHTYISEEGITVTSYADGTPQPSSLYVDSYLEKKDKYSYFLGGNQPLCVIETEQTDAPKVLVIRDSYADALAPFLTQRFSEIHLFDLRYNLTSVKSYVEEHDIDAVVVLYSFANFATDPYLFLMGR
jgi:hypothetical protein